MVRKTFMHVKEDWYKMSFSTLDEIKDNGFNGFKKIRSLWTDSSDIPDKPGVYLVLRDTKSPMQFIEPGVGGFFKGKDPNIPLEKLTREVIPNTIVVYIGKAGSLSGKSTLRSRIRQYLRFGQGKNIGHWGGRYIWQLKDHSDLLLCWKVIIDEEPRVVEQNLLQLFETTYGKKPFANIAS